MVWNRGSALRSAGSVESVRKLAKRRLPRGLFEFVDRGSDDELALAYNRASFDSLKFRPRTLVDVSQRSTSTTILGQSVGMPIVIAPTGSASLLWYKGELELARAAADAKVPFALANRSLTPLESIAEQPGGLPWFQVYPLPDREDTYALLDRALKVGYEVLVVTVDTPLAPSREYNVRNGYSIPFQYAPRALLDIARHPGWLLSVIGKYYAHDGMPRFENLPERRRMSEAVPIKAFLSDSLTWSDVEAFRKKWPRKLVIKGILHPDDARRAVDLGADGIVVSNHGGRNLDSAMAPIQALPDIVRAAGDRAEILLDSGIRRGSDIAKALALGARGVLIGRATLYGTAVAGREGATHVLELLRKELLYTLACLGCPRIEDLSPDILDLRTLGDGQRGAA